MKAFLKISIGARTPDLHSGLRIAVGHLTVDEKNIEGSFMGTPNVSRQRKKVLSELLNDVVKHGVRHPEQRVDLVVLPEVSVPHRWATFITRWAKDHQVGVICGLEHRVDDRNRAWNELLAALPFSWRERLEGMCTSAPSKKTLLPGRGLPANQQSPHSPNPGV